MGILLVVVLVVDARLTRGSLVLTVRHDSSVTVTGIHVWRKASRQLSRDLKLIGVGDRRP